jgi:HK97 gp10 family phage protein
VKIYVKVNEKIFSDLDGFFRRKKEMVERGLLKIAEEIKEEARARAPYSGASKSIHLRDSIDVEKEKENELKVGVRKEAYWGQFIEFGHAIKRERRGPVLGYYPPRPFLRPACEIVKERIKSIISE